MRHASLLFFLLLVFTISYGQKYNWSTAEKYFNTYQFASAADEYEKILQANAGNKQAMEKLVHCYRKLNDPSRSEILLASLCLDTDVQPPYLKLYADVLAENGKYEDAILWYKKFATVSSDVQVNKILSSYASLSRFYADSVTYKVGTVGFNSDQSDFSPAFYRGSLVFCSARRTQGNMLYPWDNSAYVDLYWAKDLMSTPENFGKPVNSALHEGPATFSANYDTIFFTRNNYIDNKKSKSSDGVMKLKIFFAVMTNGKWGKVQNIALNNDEYSIGHPALSPDHKLYFVSDKPGGFGGTDIYYSKYAQGQWLPPVNLGPEINSPGNEMFPFVDEKGNLYFASNGHPGLGGLDIFKAKSTLESFEAPINMGYPINSSRDDFGLITYNNRGYFSSNRGTDPQNDNIYTYAVETSVPITIQIMNKEGILLENISLMVSENKPAVAPRTLTVNKSLTHTFNTESEYTITCNQQGYLPKEEILNQALLKKLGPDRIIKIVLTESAKSIQVDLISTANGQRLAGGTIEVVNLKSRETKKYSINKDFPLTVELMWGADYEITGSQSNFKSKTLSFNIAQLDILKDPTTLLIELMPATTLFERNEIGQIIELDIKYDVGKSTIRADAAKELDKLVEFLRKNPTVKVELGSHTDIRGSEESNHKLSQRRAESAVRYILNKGINSKRLVPIGYGEDDPKVQNAVTEEEHQQNRRTTVKIVGI